MPTLDELELQRQAVLKRAVSLTKTVVHGDKRVDYDLTMAQQALALIESEKEHATDAPKRRVRQMRIVSNKDL
ncbi:MAG: hypothetical protein HQL74_12530 [Magnetococcales bacterium]|nr:hypothetical protein [Magnetococcales bacterium]